MPSRKIHRKISKIVVGKSCDKTHKMIDYPVRYLGRNHRVLFHDPLTAMVIGFFCDGYEGAISGLLHTITDKYVKRSLASYIYRTSKFLNHNK